MLGSKKTQKGYEFKTYAPNAKEVNVYINGQNHKMIGKDGYWFAEIEGVEDNTLYTYNIDGKRKCDPYTNKVIEFGKGNPESVTYNSQYEFKHQKENRILNSIYEVYLKNIGGDTFQEKAKQIIEGAQGYSHIQIMPFNYTPNKKTLGYKTSTYFAPEPKYGDLDDLKEMIDILHEHKFNVILDFSIFEFEEFSNTGLKLYDGTTLFERKDKKQHPIFTGFYFDIEKPFVRQFLKDVVHFLINDLKADGIRIDGVNEVVFINKGETQDINEQGLEFIKELLNELPTNAVVIADMLTHHTLEELGLQRINRVEANIFMFQVQNIIKQGKDWFTKNLEREAKLLHDTLKLTFENKYIATINHDIHINGIENELTNGKLDSKKQFDFLKFLIYALPVPKQIYYKADIDQDFTQFIDNISVAEFSFNIFDNGVIQFQYGLEQRRFDLYFNIFEESIEVYETVRKTIL